MYFSHNYSRFCLKIISYYTVNVRIRKCIYQYFILIVTHYNILFSLNTFVCVNTMIFYVCMYRDLRTRVYLLYACPLEVNTDLTTFTVAHPSLASTWCNYVINIICIARIYIIFCIILYCIIYLNKITYL